MDLKAIADALAAQFVGVTANGEAISVGPTASLPNGINAGPALLVYHPIGVLAIGVSRLRSDEYDFPIRLLRDPTDVPSRSDALYAWHNAMRDVVEANMDLGLGTYVAWARPVASRVELDGETYNRTNVFDVVELMVRVHINEVVTTVAI